MIGDVMLHEIGNAILRVLERAANPLFIIDGKGRVSRAGPTWATYLLSIVAGTLAFYAVL